MENQSGGGEMSLDGVYSLKNHPLHQPPLNNNHQATFTLSDIERFLLSDDENNNNTLQDETLEMPFSAGHQPVMDPDGALSNNFEDANTVLIVGSKNQKSNNNQSFYHDQNQEINVCAGERHGRQQNAATDHIIRQKWTTQEDMKLLSLVSKHGAGKWNRIAPEMKGRDRKQCYARWKNYLCPDVKKKDQWSEEEEKVFIEAHQIFGNKWTKIAKRIPGRSGSSIKNHWYLTQRKVMKMKN